ncbi:hypothetical protein MAR_003833 [Mya arenaria]|uniref:DNA-directed DNA polymerase n=1 Tax=Mya arenaria TaxID=6604 RepID=A0ABY7EUW9_MYAAR|nr:hypothetical protein MAR_003833 [Mya arenaria]
MEQTSPLSLKDREVLMTVFVPLDIKDKFKMRQLRKIKLTQDNGSGGCNLKYTKPKFTPIVFHNLSGYDSHLFIKNLGTSEGNINCIPNNEEKYISLTKEVIVDSYTDKDGKEKDVKHQLRFIDSFKFMSSSLDKLSGNLDRHCFKNTSKYYNGGQLDLLLRKGVYPYEYMDSLKRLDETILPPKEAFYSRLSGDGISDKDYKHAQNVWKQFGMKTLRDYHDLYNQSDVLLLADVFENFRDVCSKNYGLDPAWYYTAPGLAWDAALKITEVKLELLSDPDMLLMVEKGIRGGISMISNRYGKANNPYMGVAIHMKKTKLVFNKPVYLGMCILDLSKTSMYDFHYNYIKKKYEERAKLLFSDTDSLAYEVQTEDFYKDISGDVAAKFDTSNFPKNHPSGIEDGHNKKVVGMFKDEAGGEIIEEFVGLRAKLYSYKMLKGNEEKKCKGVKKPVVKKSIQFGDYKECLFTGMEQLRKMNVIRSHGHEVYTEEVNKVALSANDDKRVILEGGIQTLAYVGKVVLPNKPLSNIELIEAVRELKIPHFRGVFLRDTLPKRPQGKECGILNLDSSDGGETHWVAWFKREKKMPVHKFGMNSEIRKESSDSISLSYLNKNERKGEVANAIVELKNENKQLRKYLEKLQREIYINYITIWAEERGGLSDGRIEFSFGDGSTGKRGDYPVLTRSKILKMGVSVSSTAPAEETTVAIVINGVNSKYKITKPSREFTHVIDIPKVDLESGDTLNFVSESTTKLVSGAVVSLLLEIYL